VSAEAHPKWAVESLPILGSAYVSGRQHKSGVRGQRMQLRFAIALVLFLIAATAFPAPKKFTLIAEPGKFNASTLSAHAPRHEVTGTLRVLSFNGTEAWPTAAYLGIQEGPNRNRSVQVLAIRNRASDEFLVVGYRMIVDGREVKVDSIENVALGAIVRVGIVFRNGIATIRVNGGPPIEIKTPFREVASYVSVSSGHAEFAIDP
jgi:hypothetical protein